MTDHTPAWPGVDLPTEYSNERVVGVHIIQFIEDWALCCDNTVRALITQRHHGGQSIIKELVSNAGRCGCSSLVLVTRVLARLDAAKIEPRQPPKQIDPYSAGDDE